MEKEKIRLLWMLLLFLTVSIHGQEASKVSLVIKGGMYVSSSGAANMYVLGGIRTVNGVVPVSIVQEGVTKLTGNFYQDCSGHAFNVDDGSGYGTSTGTVCFFDSENPQWNDLSAKYITSKDSLSFNRAANYVAFPKVQIDMDKNLILPSRMGADMDMLIAQRAGNLWLNSHNYDYASNPPGHIYDASLRFPKRGETDDETNQSAKAPRGKIIVEQDITGYRGTTNDLSVMFPFATPFCNTQLSGYFAGNWVRRPVADATTHHTEYPYGDETIPGSNVIARDQYVTNPLETLVPGQAYLIKPLGTSEFDNLPVDYPEYGLQITGDGAPVTSDYKKTLFVFDGSVYKLLPNGDEQLNLMPIFDATVKGDASKTINILIGNSYTSAIDLKKLSEYMIASPLSFNRQILVYCPHLATPYTPFDAFQYAPGQVTAPWLLPENTIPGMGVFMLRLAKQSGSAETITIDRTFLTQGNNAHNLRSSEGFNNEVLFTLTYDSIPNMYDLAAIGIRNNSKEALDAIDMQKTTQETIGVPILYTLSSDNVKIASNAVPQGTQSVRLCVESGLKMPEKCTLQVSRQESMQTEYLLLEDKMTGSFINLYEQDSYSFTSNPGDLADRFVVHFVRPAGLGIADVALSPLKLYYNKETQSIEIKELTAGDMNSRIIITDTQGRILQRESISESVAVGYLPEGVYIAKVIGNRTAVLKFAP